MVKKAKAGVANFAVPADPRIKDPKATFKLDKHPKEDAELSDPMATYMSVLAMLFGILAIVFKWKVMAFQSIVCSMISFANTKTAEVDTKQILSAFSIAIMALVMCYRQEFVAAQ
mmetsp:Transcript_109182/g.163314  ORF Transcript_109182/g.163314 Transcript_109182/m.163314 type:complete len:115 (+) Transcript_109182:3-347(+)